MPKSKVLKGEGYCVLCPGCGQAYHETTKHFASDRATTGLMLRLRPQWGEGGENWSTFPSDSAVRDADLECPGCGTPYSAGTRVTVMPLDPWESFGEQEAAEIESLEAADVFVQSVNAIGDVRAEISESLRARSR